MFFTREDIEKIHQGLLRLGIKDSELPETTNVNSDDTLAVVQDGKNKKINIEEFFNNISLFKKEGFINITDRFNKHSISLIEAIQTVPTHQRIDGLVITFEDINGDWRIYQFRGDAVDFFDENKWTDLYDYTNYIVKSITPDEEDLTVSKPDKNGNAIVSLKDRVYDESNFSGKGYKILRKNIQTIDGVRKNILTQNMINKPNTIYEIRYDFDLNGKTLSIPSNCVLKFVSGVLSNGIISGNNTTIVGAEYGAFDSVRLSGSFTNIESNLSWWGCVPFDVNNQYDNSSKIEDAFRSSISRVGVSKIYGVSKPINIGCRIVGTSEQPGYKFCGFYANSDFSPITITLPRDGKTYEVNGLFYHSYDQHPSIENLTIDLRYYAKYAIEHIAGYSNIEISNVSIYNALVAGILQYGCEKMTWNTLWVSNCRYGAIISTNKFDENNPFSFGSATGQCNMVTLEHCRFVAGNYGLVCNGGSNFKLDSCETAYNSLYGLILIGSTFLLPNYYSEGDCLANFWIDTNGIKSYPNSNGGITTVVNEWDKGKTHPYLIENNIDGILCHDGAVLESNPYMRAIIYANDSRITLISPFLSILPRSYNTSDISVTTRELPTERNAHGIDALIISDSRCSIILKNIMLYSLTNDIGTEPFTDIVMKGINYTGYTNANNSIVSCDGRYQVELWYDYFNNRVTNFNYYRIGYTSDNRRDNYNPLIDIKPTNKTYEDLNSDQDSWVYGTSIFTPYKHHSFKGYVKNVPVYKRDTNRKNYGMLRFTKAQSLSKFGDRMQIKCKFVAYIPEDVTSRITLGMSFIDSSNSTISDSITDTSGNTLIKAGYYELTTIVPVRPKESEFNDWAITQFVIGIYNEPTIDVYVSNIYFFDIGDGSELCDNSNPVLVSGTTDIRPYLPFVGQSYFDTTIGKSIVWNGTEWTNIDGTTL